MQQPTTYTAYQKLMAQIETLLQKATTGGGFAVLSPDEATELA
ncbi:hypothetical protein [Spirosoma radiotolerans]|nr:hypothetical protein [Spirosoma radiotolerans]